MDYINQLKIKKQGEVLFVLQLEMITTEICKISAKQVDKLKDMKPNSKSGHFGATYSVQKKNELSWLYSALIKKKIRVRS